ncbi:MAG: rod shape-determining protein MreC [Patescibacteria group bacterium]|nr:rod shape-determining protein MreC [Patescibacteria group bacterium]
MKQFLRTRWGKVAVIVIGILVLIVVQYLHLLRPAESAIVYLTNPIQSVFINAAQRIKRITNYFGDINSLKKRNEVLEENLSRTTSENLLLRQKITDIEEAQQQLSFLELNENRTVMAKAIGRSSEEYQRIIILNKGSAEGIQAGYPAIVQNGILIGKIIAVTAYSSKVLLLDDSHSQVLGIIENTDKSPGVIAGQYGISLIMDLIPEEHTIERNQTVTSSGLESFIPSNLIIGSVSRIEKIEGALFQKATITPAVDYQKINVVSVILPDND